MMESMDPSVADAGQVGAPGQAAMGAPLWSTRRGRAQRIGARPGSADMSVADNPIGNDTESIAYLKAGRDEVEYAGAPVGGWSKRAFDIGVSAAALVVLAPLLVLIAVLVRLDSPGQAIFRQERGGFRGKPFRIWKFRTMRVMENRNIVQARHNDARFTRLGAFLRRSSLDELPQLFNVLIGDMSIVGPRPHALEHDAKFARVDPRYELRFCARPGVTGSAQVNGCRGPTETSEKIRKRTGYDVEYVRHWTWAREIKVLARTAAILLKGDDGAL